MDFTGKAIVYQGFTLDSEGSHWILTQEAKAIVGTTYKLVCPKGMETDGASIPRFFWRVCGSPFTFCLLAYLIHDEHRAAADELVDAEIRKQARKAADILFSEMLYSIDRYCRHISVPGWKRKAMYLAVRWHARQLNGHSQS